MNAVQRLRAAGYTRRQIAESVGVTRHAVGFWERGLRFPSRENHGGLIRLADAKGLRLLAEDFHAAPDRGGMPSIGDLSRAAP